MKHVPRLFATTLLAIERCGPVIAQTCKLAVPIALAPSRCPDGTNYRTHPFGMTRDNRGNNRQPIPSARREAVRLDLPHRLLWDDERQPGHVVAHRFLWDNSKQ